MSHELYCKWWIASKGQLRDLRIKDNILRRITKPIKDRGLANQLVGGLYSRYSMAVQDIDVCLDQYCQVQKSFTIRKLMDAATTRLKELKEELVKIDLSEYHYIDGTLIELKVIPHEIEILHPALFYPRPEEIQNMWERIKKGETIYIPPPPEIEKEVLEGMEDGAAAQEKEIVPVEELPKEPEPVVVQEKSKPKRPKPQKFVPQEPELSPAEIAAKQMQEKVTQAVKFIQTFERARQCRLYFFELYKRHQMKKDTTVKQQELDPEMIDKAANKIQTVWKGYAARALMKRREKERRLLIGMNEPSWKSTKEQEKVQKTAEERQALRYQHIRDYIKANLDGKERVLRVIGPRLMEDIGDEIREWFYQWYIRAKNFDKYPPEEKGGTVLVVRCETMTPEEWLIEVERKRIEKQKQKARGGKDKDKELKAKKKAQEAEQKKKEKEKKKKEAAAAKKRKKNIEELDDYKLEESKALDKFKQGFKEHREMWDDRFDSENPLQNHYMDMITEQKCCEMQLELRQQVDVLMRLELEMLNDAHERDKWNAKKGKGKKGKDNKGKKGKQRKGKKGKKDPTGHRTTEDLFQELSDNGIIRTYPTVHLDEFKGDFSYCNWEKRNMGFDPPATLGDVRQAVMLNCILPFGVEAMEKPKSVLIAGPRQSGKHLLANAIFTETQCVLFDLSPPILAGKYQGKKEMKMLLHLINKMSRLLQPSIIYFDGGEKPFYKKVPKPEKELEPKKMGKKLFKGIVKPILPEDRVFVLGVTGQPWAAKQSGMKKAFEKVILIPRPDYGSVFLYWREMLMPFHGVDRELNLTALTTLTVKYPLPEIRNIVRKVMVPGRIVELSYNPLNLHEFLTALLEGPGPITDKEWKKFENWFKNTNLGKQRAKYAAVMQLRRDADEKAKAKQKK